MQLLPSRRNQAWGPLGSGRLPRSNRLDEGVITLQERYSTFEIGGVVCTFSRGGISIQLCLQTVVRPREEVQDSIPSLRLVGFQLKFAGV